MFRASLLALAALLAAPFGAAADSGVARVIVRFKADASALREHPMALRSGADEARRVLARRAAALGARGGITLAAGAAVDPTSQVVFASGIDAAALARRLRADPDVEAADPDQRRRRWLLPDDPRYTSGGPSGPAVGQWYLRPPAGAVVSSIDAESAWDVTTGSDAIVVAVIDTGVRFDHADLAGRLLPGYDMISNVAVANDGDGRDDDASDPGDWVTPAEAGEAGGPYDDCDAAPSSWHGTQIAGLIGAATNNGIGMAGVAWQVRLLPVRVLGKCSGFDSDIVAGMRWAAGLPVPGVPANPTPARVLNLSLGGSGACTTVYRSAVNEITARGAVVVAAAGNSTGRAVSMPANCPGVIGVAALRHIGTKVGFSDIGPEIAIAAPGGNCVNLGGACLYPLLTTTNEGTAEPVAGSSAYTDSFNISVGTSVAAPLVAGTAALMLSVQPALQPAEVRALMRETARAFPREGAPPDNGTPVPVCRAPGAFDQLQCYCTTTTCGAGMLDTARAVAAAAGVELAPSSPPPAPEPQSSPGGGGGASGAGWLLLLAFAAAVAGRRP